MVETSHRPKLAAGDGVWVLFGRDLFLKSEFIARFRNNFFSPQDNSQLNYREFVAGEQSLAEVFDFIRSAPFLGERKLTVLKDIDELEDEDRDALEKFIISPPRANALILTSLETNTRGVFMDSISKTAKAIPCHTPFDRDMPLWVETRARDAQKLMIERPAALLLIDKTGKDLGGISQALEELSLFIHPRTKITVADVAALLGKSSEDDVFLMIDCIVEKKAAQALGMLQGLLKEGGAGYEVLSVLASQFERLKRAAFLAQSGYDPKEVASSLKINSFFYEKFARQLRLVNMPRLEKIAESILKCDESIKTGSVNDRAALGKLVVEISS